MSENLLEITDISKNYGENCVLKHITFSLDKGETLAVIGPSGSGKSTLLHIIGLLDRPSSGSITLNSTEVTNISDELMTKTRKANIGFIYQFHYLINELTVLENVTLSYQVKFGHACNQETAHKILENLGILHKKDNFPNQLSGGEKQRTAIARAIITAPDLILADEPTGNLDKENAQRVKADLFRLVHETEAALILSTHDTELSSMCDRRISLNK